MWSSGIELFMLKNYQQHAEKLGISLTDYLLMVLIYEVTNSYRSLEDDEDVE